MNCKFYLLLTSFLCLFTPKNGASQATLKWEKTIHVSQFGVSNAMVTDANLNSYIITAKEDSSFFYKYDSIGTRIFKIAFPQNFESTSQAQLVNQSQIIFFGNIGLQAICYRLDLNGNFIKTTILPAKEFIMNFDCDANSNVYYLAQGFNLFTIGKINSSGTLDWHRDLNDSNTYNKLNPVIQCGTHSDLILTYDCLGPADQSIANPIVSINTNNGDIQWKSFVQNRSLPETTIYQAATSLDNAGDIVAYATTYDTISGNTNSWLVKFGYANGAIISRDRDTSSTILNNAFSLYVMSDNKVIVIGSNIITFGNIIRCLNMNGSVNWTRNINSRFVTLMGHNDAYAAPESNRILFAEAPISGITETVRIMSLNSLNRLQLILEYRHQSTKQPLFHFTPILIGDLHLINGSLMVLGNAAETFNSSGFDPSEAFILRYTMPSLTGISTDIKTDQNWILYPNPVNDKLYLECAESIPSDIQYYIYDALGKLISQGGITTGVHEINTMSLASGLYTIQLGESIHKFIK